MKIVKHRSLLSMLLISFCCFSQNVGIGVAVPAEALSIDRGLITDNNNQNAGLNLLSGLRFWNSANNSIGGHKQQTRRCNLTVQS